MNRDKIHNKPDEYGYGHGEDPVPAGTKKENPHPSKKTSKRFSGKITERKLERGYDRRVK